MCEGKEEGNANGFGQFNEEDAESVAIALLDDLDWRVRAVERIDLTSASWSDRKRSIHAKPLRSWLPPSIKEGAAKEKRVYLPIGNFPKGPLLDFSVTVADRQGYLLTRKEHADIHVHYMQLLAAEAGVPMDAAQLDPLLSAIFSFATSPWQDFLVPESEAPSPDVLEILICNYLNKGTIPGWRKGPIDIEMVREWSAALSETRKLVTDRVPSNLSSVTENPLLILPYVEIVDVSNSGRVLNLFETLNRFLVEVSKKAETVEAAKKLVQLYAVSGSHWNAIAECTVPLDEPFMIKTWERRGLLTERARRSAKQQLVLFRDAQSNHVSVRVSDANVELVASKVTVLDEGRTPLGRSTDFKRATPDLLAFYDGNPGRPERILLDLPLKSSHSATVSRFVILVLTASALLAFCFFLFHWAGAGGKETMTGADIAVILIPAALAASLLLVRETSTLSTEVNKYWAMVVGVILLVLWISALIAYGVNGIDWGSS
ncbi:hypothetical protein [Streptomyces sp. NBC_01006]|uniref:hypothetical protein n=1 Tax=Streptomyces sp. NBC_01006 TaxID=2903716 RepID=UPI00386D0660|nr:hypothetical protein OG509_30780 [Streptomyces sp. NBC_01006]